MGLDANKGVPVADVKLALRGHVKEGYVCNPECRLSEDDLFYNKTPTANDYLHVLVCLLTADTISRMNVDTVQKIRYIRMEASLLGVPQVAILTKIDEVCPEIKKDVRNVYKVKYLKKKMEELSVEVGIPINCIFPLKNYHSEIDLDSHVNSLILSAMTHIIHFGDDLITSRSRSEC